MPTSIAVCRLLNILVYCKPTLPSRSTYLRQELRWIDIFMQTVFDPMLAQSDLPNRFISNPSGASTLFFLGRRRDEPGIRD